MCSGRGSSKIVVIAAAILVFIAGGKAGAGMFFSTFGPGDSYDEGTGWIIGDKGPNLTQGDQFSFTGPQDFLYSIELAAALVEGDNQLDVSLMTDAAGNPGSVLESFSFAGQLGVFGSRNPLLVGTSVLHPLLTPNTPYWLVASNPSNAFAAWNWSLPSVAGLHADRVGAGSWNTDYMTMGAFRINNGTPAPAPVPVPAAFLLGTIGLSFAGWRLRRKTE